LKSTKNLYEAFINGKLFAYFLLFSIPVSIPLTRLSVKFLFVWFILSLLFLRAKPKIVKKDLIALLFPLYQLSLSAFKGTLTAFFRAPNGLTPVLSYWVRFSEADVVRGLNLFLLGAAFLSIGSCVQSLFSVPDYRLFFSGNFHLHLSVHRPNHTFVGHPLTAGALVSAAFILSLLLYLRHRRALYLLSALLNLSAVILLFNRTYWVAVLSFSFVIFFFILRNLKLFAILTLAFAVSIFSVPQLKERFVSIFDVKHNGSNRYRIAMWVGALEFFSQAPLSEKLFGVGRDGYRKEVKPFVERAQKRFSLHPHFFSHLHSDYITVLIWYGILGLFIFLFTFFYFMWVNLKAFRGTGDYLYLFFFSFYLLILVGGVFEYNLEDEAVKYMIYAFMGLNVKLLAEKGAP